MLAAARAGRSALLVAPTGAGKTLAGFLPTLAELIEAPTDGLHTLYISPLKALAVDVQRNLLTPIEEMGLPIRVETRTGDTPVRPQGAPARAAAADPADHARIAEPAAQPRGQPARCSQSSATVVVDEIHAFATGKRGDLLALSLARLQAIAPGLRRVGLSATVADPEAFQGWLAPHGDAEMVDAGRGRSRRRGRDRDHAARGREDPLVGPFGPLGGART